MYIYGLVSKIFLPSCLCLGRAPIQTPNFVQAGRVVPCVGVRAHVTVPKMLSCDFPCVFCMFVWLVLPISPYAFVWVMHSCKPQILFDSCTHGNPKFIVRAGWVISCVGACANVFEQVESCHVWVPMQMYSSESSHVTQGRSFEGTQGRSGRVRSPRVGWVVSCEGAQGTSDHVRVTRVGFFMSCEGDQRGSGQFKSPKAGQVMWGHPGQVESCHVRAPKAVWWSTIMSVNTNNSFSPIMGLAIINTFYGRFS